MFFFADFFVVFHIYLVFPAICWVLHVGQIFLSAVCIDMPGPCVMNGLQGAGTFVGSLAWMVPNYANVVVIAL